MLWNQCLLSRLSGMVTFVLMSENKMKLCYNELKRGWAFSEPLDVQSEIFSIKRTRISLLEVFVRNANVRISDWMIEKQD